MVKAVKDAIKIISNKAHGFDASKVGSHSLQAGLVQWHCTSPSTPQWKFNGPASGQALCSWSIFMGNWILYQEALHKPYQQWPLSSTWFVCGFSYKVVNCQVHFASLPILLQDATSTSSYQQHTIITDHNLTDPLADTTTGLFGSLCCPPTIMSILLTFSPTWFHPPGH